MWVGDFGLGTYQTLSFPGDETLICSRHVTTPTRHHCFKSSKPKKTARGAQLQDPTLLAAISFQILFVFGFFGNASVNLPNFAAVLLDSLVFWFLRCWCLTGKVFEVLVPNRKGPGRPQTKKTKESKSTAAKVGKLIEAFPKKQKNKIWREMAATKPQSCSRDPRAGILVSGSPVLRSDTW